MNNANANIGDIKDSVLNTDSIVYTTTGSNGTGNVLRITITIDDVNANQYITIVPQEGTIQGKGIEDYSFNVGNSAGKTTQVLADSNNANLNQAIMNISCTRDENKDQVTVRRDVNTAKNATKVEIAYKTDASQ
ncbi:hypothetical protein KAZ93_01735 [Patescibacteria group bacterium]|nr:hypothetical protein [Patescibacteria group bacterium]